jgi:hypothetical protein
MSDSLHWHSLPLNIHRGDNQQIMFRIRMLCMHGENLPDGKSDRNRLSGNSIT